MDVPLQGTDQDDDGEAPVKAKRKPFKATQKALGILRAQGYTAAIVEHWNPHARIRQDLFGVFDLLAIRAPDVGVLALQVTTTQTAKREQKIAAEPRALEWLRCGNGIEVWGFSKTSGGVRGGRKLWTLRRTRASLSGDAIIVWTSVEG